MNLERFFLTISGLVGIVAFFLPFMSIQMPGIGQNRESYSFSGYSLTEMTIDYYTAPETEVEEDSKLVDKLWDLPFKWWEKSAIADKALGWGIFLVILGPFYFILFSLGHFYRGVMGKQFKRGIFFALLFMGFAWLMFFLLSKRVDLLNFNFFKMASIGFWLAFGAVIGAAFSMFFSKNLGTESE